jgi:prophage regulatory protein
MNEELLDRLRTDPGQRTLGQLLQEREAAYQEIQRLRGELETLRAARKRASTTGTTGHNEQAKPALRSGTLISIKELCKVLDVSRATIYRWTAEQSFPAPVRLGRHSVRWRVEEVQAWMGNLEVGQF